jgi:hypothetical protein
MTERQIRLRAASALLGTSLIIDDLPEALGAYLDPSAFSAEDFKAFNDAMHSVRAAACRLQSLSDRFSEGQNEGGAS